MDKREENSKEEYISEEEVSFDDSDYHEFVEDEQEDEVSKTEDEKNKADEIINEDISDDLDNSYLSRHKISSNKNIIEKDDLDSGKSEANQKIDNCKKEIPIKENSECTKEFIKESRLSSKDERPLESPKLEATKKIAPKEIKDEEAGKMNVAKKQEKIESDKLNYTLNFNDIEKSFFGKKSDGSKNLKILYLKEFLFGFLDVIEVAARFSFLSIIIPALSLYILGITFFGVGFIKKSRINLKKIIFYPLGIYFKPLFDGRYVPFIIFNLMIVFLANSNKNNYSYNILIIYSILMSLMIWPIYRLIYSIATKMPFNSKFCVNGFPHVYKLKKSFKDEYDWALDSSKWIETDKLNYKEIRRLDKDFEVITAELFYKLGFQVEHTGKSGDGGIDVIAKSDSELFIISCKRFSGAIQPNYVRELYGIVQSERFRNSNAIGILVTTVGFSKGSIEFAAKHNLKLLTLEQLIGLYYRKK